MLTYLYIALGGGLGSVARYAIFGAAARGVGEVFPWGTLTANVQRASILDLSGNLPLMIELVDDEAKLRDFFRSIHRLKDIGLVTLQPVEV